MKSGLKLWVAATWIAATSALALSKPESPKVGSVPPQLELGTIIAGPPQQDVRWDKLKGKVVVLEFWNTACVPCIEAIPHWNDLVAQFTNKPVVFISISDDNASKLRDFLKRWPISGWLALDAPLGPTAHAFGISGIPHTVIVDASGKIAAITHPSDLQPRHVDEILEDKPSSLPPPGTSDAPVERVEIFQMPKAVEVSITGPVPKPEGAYAHCSWRSNCVFRAEKAPVPTILSQFFHVSPKLLPKLNDEESLYNAVAAAPLAETNELRRRFIAAAKEKWGLDVTPVKRAFDVYVMTVAESNAPALRRSDIRQGGGQVAGGFKLGGLRIEAVADFLEMSLDKPVINETGLEGRWAAELKWEMTADELSGKGEA
ncbi:MAG TPA: redoxin domain-containing protein, partial [Verrucomicrobiae bacterium]|nr:redoxin domain-containing protein [Verrucomicrobiae bacterium]